GGRRWAGPKPWGNCWRQLCGGGGRAQLAPADLGPWRPAVEGSPRRCCLACVVKPNEDARSAPSPIRNREKSLPLGSSLQSQLKPWRKLFLILVTYGTPAFKEGAHCAARRRAPHRTII